MISFCVINSQASKNYFCENEVPKVPSVEKEKLIATTKKKKNKTKTKTQHQTPQTPAFSRSPSITANGGKRSLCINLPWLAKAVYYMLNFYLNLKLNQSHQGASGQLLT